MRGSANDTLRPYLWAHIGFLFALSCLAFLLYSNSYYVPFVFDDDRFVPPDFTKIAEEGFISWNLFWAGSGWFLPFGAFTTPSYDRIIPFFTLALNYKWGGSDVWGYHLVNILIHLLNTLLVYLMALMLYRHYRLIIGQRKQMYCAFASAALFCSHPVSVQVTTYISQRMLSLCALFYLASMICFIRARQCTEKESRPVLRPILYAGCIWFGICALKSKEAAVALPGTILLLELCLYPKSRLSWKRRVLWVGACGFGFILFMLWHLHLLEFEGETLLRQLAAIRKQADVYTRSEYFFTECRIIMTYMRFLLAPYNPHLDYYYTVSNSLFDLKTLASFSCLLLLVAGGVRAWPRRPWLSLMIFFWLGNLAPSSGLFPTSELMFEYRAYLPATLFWVFLPYFLLSIFTILKTCRFSVFLLPEGISSEFWEKKVTPLIIVGWTTIFSIQTYTYNKVFQDPVRLWGDSIAKSPEKPRPYLNRGLAYETKKQFHLAIADYKKVIALDQNYADAHFNLANTYTELKEFDLAIVEYKKVMTLKPDFVETYNNLGLLYSTIGRHNIAIETYTAGLEINPGHYKIYNNRGLAYFRLGRYEEAVLDYTRSISLLPSYAIAYFNRAGAYYELGSYNAAVQDLTRTIELDNKYADARLNRGLAYWFAGQRKLACDDWKADCQLGNCVPYRQAQKRKSCE